MLKALTEKAKEGVHAVPSYGYGILQNDFKLSMDDSYEVVRYWMSLRRPA